jgi:large subunit ribosomal protein L22
MEVRAIAKSVRVSPRKVRLVADAIRNLSIEEALQVLDAAEKRAALPIAKTLKSAVANAVNNAKLEKGTLLIGSIQVAEGQPLKRFHPSTRGRIHPYKKRSSHITVVLKEDPKAVAAAVATKKTDDKKAVKKDEKKEKKGGARG